MKDRVHHTIEHERPQKEQVYSAIISLTSSLNGSGSLTPHPHRFTPGNDTEFIV